MRPRIHIYVPGFPGEAVPRIPGEKRVVDVVAEVAIANNLNLEIVSYPGIRNSEQFTFEKTLKHTLKIIEEKIEKGYSITLIGQSWGGLISLLALNHFSIDRLVLITPFILSLDSEKVSEILKFYSSEFPDIIPTDSIPNNVESISRLFDSLEKLQQREKLPSEVKILASSEDVTIPINDLTSFFSTCNIFKSPAVITETLNDHDFSHGTNELTDWLNKNV